MRKIPIFNAGTVSTKRYRNPRLTEKPSISLLVSPWRPPLVPVELLGKNMDELLVSLTVMKSRCQPAGSMAFTLHDEPNALKGLLSAAAWNKFKPDLEDLFHSMSIVQLWWDGYHVMTCFVESANRVLSPKGERQIAVQCHELSALYNESILTRQLRLYGQGQHLINDTLKALELTGNLTGLPLPQAVNRLCNAYWSSTLSYVKGFPFPYFRASDGLPMTFRFIAQSPPVGCISNASLYQTLTADSAMLATAEGSGFWQYLTHLISPPFVELTCESGGRTICTGRVSNAPSSPTEVIRAARSLDVTDTSSSVTPMLPGFNYLVLRSAPFDNPMLGGTAWKQLYRFSLGVQDLLAAGDFVIGSDDDLLEMNVGKSCARQFTVFHGQFTGGHASNDAGKLMARPSIASGPLYQGQIQPGGIRTFPTRVFEWHLDGNSLNFSGLSAQLQDAPKSYFDGFAGVLTFNNLANVYWRNQHNFHEGSLTYRAMPWARPGMLHLHLKPLVRRMRSFREQMMFYIDNVVHEIQPGQPPRTTMSVIRGTPIPATGAEINRFASEWEIHPIIPEFSDSPGN